jgi:hypothetical protein
VNIGGVEIRQISRRTKKTWMLPCSQTDECTHPAIANLLGFCRFAALTRLS